jgi:5-methylcytosine-specific restriction protein A
MMPTAADFRVTLRARMQGAEHASKTTVEINSGQLHREVGGYPGQNHRMPMCCAMMRSEMSAGDGSYRSLRRSRALRSRSATSYPVADGDDHAEGAQMLGHWFVGLVVMLQDILQTRHGDRCREVDPRRNRSPRNCSSHSGGG